MKKNRLFLEMVCENNVNSDVMTVEEKFEIAKKNRLVETFLCLDETQNYNGIDSEFLKKVTKGRLKCLEKVVETLNENNIHYLFVKGVALRKYYPNELHRQSKDYDVVVEDINHFWKMYLLLIEMGFTIVYFPSFTMIKKELKGSIMLKMDLLDGDEFHLEINIGGFPIGSLYWLESSVLFEEKEYLNLFGETEKLITIPNRTNSILILLSELVTRNKIDLKDLMDYHFLLQKKPLNNELFNNKLKEIDLLSFSYKALNNVNRNYIHTNLFPFYFKNEIYNNLYGFFMNRQVKKAYLYFLIGILRKLTTKKILLKFVRKIEKGISVQDNYYMGIPTTFIPFSETLKGELDWLILNKEYFLITPVGTFLASNLCLYNQDEMHLLNELLEAYELKLQNGVVHNE